jgi:hypothetical protein
VLTGSCPCGSSLASLARVADIAGRRDDDFRYGTHTIPAGAFRHVLGTNARISEYEVRQTSTGAEVLVVGSPRVDAVTAALTASLHRHGLTNPQQLRSGCSRAWMCKYHCPSSTRVHIDPPNPDCQSDGGCAPSGPLPSRKMERARAGEPRGAANASRNHAWHQRCGWARCRRSAATRRCQRAGHLIKVVQGPQPGIDIR